MSRLNRNNIDRITNKPELAQTEGITPDLTLRRSEQVRRDDDTIRTVNRTLYDVDYAIKWYIDNEIQPQIIEQDIVTPVSVIYANGEKWDNARRLGYIRDEKGMIQSPIIMLKRTSVVERDNLHTLDVNRIPDSNYITAVQKYNPRNRYEDELFPIPTTPKANSSTVYVIDIPKYITAEYEMIVWCNFTTQLNDLIDQIMPYGRYSWGNEGNKFETAIGTIAFEIVNTVGEDRIVRATIPLTVQASLQSEQESRISTIKKRYSIKKVSFDLVLDLATNIFDTTTVPPQLLQASQQIFSGASAVVTNPAGPSAVVDAAALTYLLTMRDEIATFVNSTTISIAVAAAINPITNAAATKNEFNIYINGQYIDKVAYTWTPTATTQTIIFDTTALGYPIELEDLIVVNGRWA